MTENTEKNVDITVGNALTPSERLFGTSANSQSSSDVSDCLKHAAANHDVCPINLTIVTQPSPYCRFRQESDQGNALPPVATESSTRQAVTVKVLNGLNGNSFVTAAAFGCDENGQRTTDSEQKCNLVGNCKVTTDGNGLASFSDLRINRLSDGPHCIRIGFQASSCNPLSGEIWTQSQLVYSQPIHDFDDGEAMQPRILALDRSSCLVSGADELWIRCSSRVESNSTLLTFHDVQNGWTSTINLSASEVHGSFIICSIPPYCTEDIDEAVEVQITLTDTINVYVSQPVPFTYLPIRHTEKPSAFTTALTPADQPTVTELLALLGGDGVNDKRLHRAMSDLWVTHLNALWQFGADGDPQAMVAACRHLIGWQNEEDGNTVLHVAVRNKQPFALKTLLNAIASPDPDVAETANERNAIVNRRNARRQTALHCAVRYGDADSVHYLIAAGAERTHIDSNGNTVAHYLADTYNEAIYKDILFPPQETTAHGQKLDLALRNADGVTPLLLATKRLKLTLIEDLLDAGSPLDVQCRVSGKTALHFAVEHGDIDIVDCLLQHGASVLVEASDGSTPLHWAVLDGDERIIAKLIEKHANVDAKTALWTPTVQPDSVVTANPPIKCTPKDVVGGNERLLGLLSGQKLEPMSTKQRRSTTMVHEPRFKPKPDQHQLKPRYAVSGVGLLSRRDDGDGGPSEDILMLDDDEQLLGAVGGVATTPSQFRMRDDDAPEMAAALKDDMSTIDFVTRLRVSKLLDADGRWERLAEILGCNHMIEFLTVCTLAEEESSPTIMLLDQYEQMRSASVSTLVKALEELGEEVAADLIRDPPGRQKKNQDRETPPLAVASGQRRQD